MHELEGLTIPAIASLLGISAVTVRWHLSMGRRDLARALKLPTGERHDDGQGYAARRRSASPRAAAVQKGSAIAFVDAAVAAAANATASARLRGFVHPPRCMAAVAVIMVVIRGVRLPELAAREAQPCQAAVRFEVRLAEDQAAAGLHEARVAGSDRDDLPSRRGRRHQCGHRAERGRAGERPSRDSTSVSGSPRKALARCARRRRITSAGRWRSSSMGTW